jgi:hypothetical protein
LSFGQPSRVDSYATLHLLSTIQQCKRVRELP